MRCFVPHLHTFSTLRSVGLMHPQYRFIPFRFVNYATLHSSSIMSAALNIFSGCSFAQPLGLAPFGEKPHFALNQGTLSLTFISSPPFHARSTTLSLRKLRFVPVLRWLFDCRNTATSLLAKKIP